MYNRNVSFLCLLTLCCFGLSSFLQPSAELADSDVSMPRQDFPIRALSSKKSKKKSTKDYYRQEILKEIEAGRWRAVGKNVKNALKKGVSYTQLKQYVELSDCKVLKKSMAIARKLDQLKPSTGLTQGESIELALYIETEFSDERAKFGNYRSRNSTGLCRSIQYDPESKLTFIHLKNHGGKKVLGEGFKKVVTPSILYHETKPEIVAHCLTTIPMAHEIAAVRALQGLDGLFKVKAITERTAKDKKTYYALLCKLYPYDTLSSFIHLGTKNSRSKREGASSKKTSGKKPIRRKMPFLDKMYIARDILTGLNNMHQRGYVHRDLGSRNYLIYKKKREEGKGMRYAAVIADLGRTLPYTEVIGQPAQGTPFYRAPEALDFERLSGKDYLYTDIYAVGCVFQTLFFDRSAPWVRSKLTRDVTIPVYERQEKFTAFLKKYREERFKALVVKNTSRRTPPIEESVERLILKMVDPVPHLRGSSDELLKIMQMLVKRAEKSQEEAIKKIESAKTKKKKK